MLVTYRFYIIFMLQMTGFLGRDTQASGSRHRKRADLAFDEDGHIIRRRWKKPG